MLLCIPFLSLAADKKAKEGKKGVVAPMPEEPKKRWQTPEELIKRTSEIKGTDTNLPDFANVKLGISRFEGDTAGSHLVASILWQEILSDAKHRDRFVDRAQTESVLRELEVSQSDWAKLSPEQKAERVGKRIAADFLVFGSITQSKSEDQQITVSEVFLDGELERYRNEYNTWSGEVNAEIERLERKIHGPESIIGFVRRKLEADKRQWEEKLKSRSKPEQLESELRTKSSFQTVASVGLAVTVIEVKSGKPVWVANGSDRNVDLDSAGKAMAKALFRKLLSNTSAP